jgi:enediyne biosynthesis protein E7
MTPGDEHSATAAAAGPPLAREAFDVASTPDSLERLAALTRECGDIFRVYAPGRRSETWVINNPGDIRRVLVTNHKNYTKGFGFDRIRLLLGNGIIVTEGELWKRQRRMMQPLFTRRVIDTYAQLVDREVDARLALWEERVRRGELDIDVTEEMSQMTLGIVLRSIFGTDLEWLTERMGANPFLMVTDDPARDLQFAYKFRSLGRLVAELAKKRDESGEEHLDFLAALMAARDKDSGEPMPPRELIDETLTLVIAGHETSASALAWAWCLLAQNPATEARLHEELARIPDRHGLTYNDTEALAYTQGVIQEGMRLYPPGWVFTRRSIEPDTLSGHALPADTDVLICPYTIHRHPAHWQAPEEFRPERFVGEDPRDRWVYVPFAAGPRHCIGENFAMYEMTVHLARAARRFRLEYIDEGPIELEAAINLRTKRNIRMRLRPRAA